jgi:tetratricopeptide (TPR) repeat protein
MVGLPFIGTVGACGGKIVAVASPGDMPQKFHWGRVLKHEFVHVVNLQQTDFNIPHWFTEGIAVRLEDLPRPTSWNEILAARLADDKLFDLSDINYGFIRPANQDDWTLAYCQAELYCEYLVKTYGDDALAKLLAAYKQNLTTEAALACEFKVTIADFEKGYKEYVAGEVKSSGSTVSEKKRAARSIVDLEAAVAKSPGDASLHAELALAQLNANDLPAARKAANAARKIDPKQPLAAYVLARIQASIGDNEAAQKLLLEVHDQQSPDERVVALLAAMELQAEHYADAEALYKLGVKHFAPREKWLRALAKIYLKTREEKPLAAVLGELAELDYDNVTLRKKLALLAKDREDWTAAAKWAKDALFIDINDADLHAQLAEALVNQQHWKPAIEEYAAAIDLNPDMPQWRMALADAYLSAGSKAEAKTTLQKLLEVAPKFPGADVMLEQLNK